MSLFFIIALLITWAIHSYLLVRFCQVLSIRIRYGFIAGLILPVVIFSLRYLDNMKGGELFAELGRIGYFLGGWVFLTLPWLILMDLVLLVSRSSHVMFPSLRWPNTIWHQYQDHRKPIGVSLIIFTSLLFLVAAWQFQRDIEVNHFTIESDKVSRDYQLLHISDLQYGSVTPAHVEKVAAAMRKAIDQHEIDLIINTGDQVDSGNYQARELQPVAFTDPPTYFSLGNHEFYHDSKRILTILYNQGYRFLRSQSEVMGELNLIGIDDSGKRGNIGVELERMNAIKADKFNILLYHRPVGVMDAKNLGIDLMLTGHTHGGQIFPYTLLVKYLNLFPQGLTKLDDFHLYTTDGAGLWGPQLRLGTQNEIAVFTIRPKAQRLPQ